jgi:hypothetical protein
MTTIQSITEKSKSCSASINAGKKSVKSNYKFLNWMRGY